MGAAGQTIIQKVSETQQQIVKTDAKKKIATSLLNEVDSKKEEILKETMKAQENLVKDKLAMGVLLAAKDGSVAFARKKQKEFENATALALEKSLGAFNYPESEGDQSQLDTVDCMLCSNGIYSGQVLKGTKTRSGRGRL